MKTAWDKNIDYDLPKLCCRKLEKSPDFQLQDGKWFVFGNDTTVKPDQVKFCPFCGKKVMIFKRIKNEYGEKIYG